MTDEARDPAFQWAPPDEGPDADFMNALKVAFERTVSDNQPYVDQCRLNYETRYAIWNGQSADGKKHAREGNGKTDPTPWDGASDIRVYLNDNVINYLVARNGLALKKANMVAVPTNGNDIERAQVVGDFMKWLVNTQIPNLDREDELLNNYILEKGAALSGQFWEERQEKTLTTFRIADFQKQFPGSNPNDIKAMLMHPALAEKISAFIVETYGVSKAKAKKVLKQLQAVGESTVPVLGRRISRPVVRAFCLDRDVFVPSWATDLETCPYIWRVEYFTAEQLRGFANTEGWNQDWVEQAILTCRGQMITGIPDSTLQPISRSFVYIDRKLMYTDLIGVVFGYQRLSDEDGVPGIYLTIFNPRMPANHLQQGYAKFGLLGYQHGEYPFVLHRREYLSRKFHDSRGLPEPGKSWQDQIKAHVDSRIDAASLAILPPLLYPLGRPPTRWGPGARVPERRPNEYHYADRPLQDMNTDNSEKGLRYTYNEYAGVQNPGEDDPAVVNTINQFGTLKILASRAKALKQVWKLWQQYGDEKTEFRVIGLQSAPPQIIEKGDPREDYDFYLSFDALVSNPDAMENKIKVMAQIAQTFDRDGQMDYSKFFPLMMQAVDANIAEQVIRPAASGQKQVIDAVQDDLTKIAAGFNVNSKIGTPPQLAQQVMQNFAQAPDVQQRYATDKDFKGRMDAYAKQIQFAQQQQQNAQIGRIGAATPQPAMQGQ